MDCLFCKIINNEIGSVTIFEDEVVKAFLDINPATNGDTLIVPKEHFKDFREVPSDILEHMYSVIKELYPKYQEKLHCDGLTISHNTDYGQEIKHFHIHFIPRYMNDEVNHLSNKEILKDLDEIGDILTN